MKFKLSNRVYDILKYICQIVLPALGTLYFAIAEIWHLGYSSEIVGTIAAVTTFLGVLLKISSNNYYKQETEGNCECQSQ